MNSRAVQNLILNTTVNKNALEIIADINQNATTSSTSIPRSKLLLVTLTTTVMLALDIPLGKEYYQWTRAYLKTIKNDDGTSLPNISGLLKYINDYEAKHKIEDDMQITQIDISSDEKIEVQVDVEETFNEDELNLKEQVLSSTKNNSGEDVENTIAPDLTVVENENQNEEATTEYEIIKLKSSEENLE